MLAEFVLEDDGKKERKVSRKAKKKKKVEILSLAKDKCAGVKVPMHASMPMMML